VTRPVLSYRKPGLPEKTPWPRIVRTVLIATFIFMLVPLAVAYISWQLL
jgi:hypothetical protein